MRELNNSSAQAETDDAYAACMERASRDPVYSVYNSLRNFIEPEVPLVKNTYGGLTSRSGSIIREDDNHRIYLIPGMRVGDVKYPEIRMYLFGFKIVPTEKNKNHDCHSREITVPAESMDAARQYLEEYLNQLYKEKGIDGSWFEIIYLI